MGRVVIMDYELTAERVREMFLSCLFKEGEEQSGAVIVPGLTIRVWFHPQRLEEQREKLVQMIDQLPQEFLLDVGGGWSFLELALRKDGCHWAEHKTMQEFLLMCIGLKMAGYLLPRDIWPSLPGGVPYIAFDPKGGVPSHD